MMQVQVFWGISSMPAQDDANKWIKNNEGKIIVKDIKFPPIDKQDGFYIAVIYICCEEKLSL